MRASVERRVPASSLNQIRASMNGSTSAGEAMPRWPAQATQRAIARCPERNFGRAIVIRRPVALVRVVGCQSGEGAMNLRGDEILKPGDHPRDLPWYGARRHCVLRARRARHPSTRERAPLSARARARCQAAIVRARLRRSVRPPACSSRRSAPASIAAAAEEYPAAAAAPQRSPASSGLVPPPARHGPQTHGIAT